MCFVVVVVPMRLRGETLGGPSVVVLLLARAGQAGQGARVQAQPEALMSYSYIRVATNGQFKTDGHLMQFVFEEYVSIDNLDHKYVELSSSF